MPPKSTKLKASGFSSNCKANPIPKARLPKHPHYLVVDTTLPSHIFSNRSLFTTYVPLHRLHRTVFDTDIIIEGIGDIEVRIVVSGKSILFRLRDSWHVPSSSHHFLSALHTISLGNQIMIAGCSPQLIFSHSKCLVELTFPKYMLFTRINSLIALEFDIPLLSPRPASPSTHPTVAPAILSLQASTYYPFAGLAAFNRKFLPTSQQVSESFPGNHAATHPSATGNMSVKKHADILPDTNQGVVLHGGAHKLPVVDIDDQLMLVDGTVTCIVNGDAEEQVANLYGGEPINQRLLETNSESRALASLNLSLNFLDLRIDNNFLVHLFTPWASSLPTSSLSR